MLSLAEKDFAIGITSRTCCLESFSDFIRIVARAPKTSWQKSGKEIIIIYLWFGAERLSAASGIISGNFRRRENAWNFNSLTRTITWRIKFTFKSLRIIYKPRIWIETSKQGQPKQATDGERKCFITVENLLLWLSFGNVFRAFSCYLDTLRLYPKRIALRESDNHYRKFIMPCPSQPVHCECFQKIVSSSCAAIHEAKKGSKSLLCGRMWFPISPVFPFLWGASARRSIQAYDAAMMRQFSRGELNGGCGKFTIKEIACRYTKLNFPVIWCAASYTPRNVSRWEGSMEECVR